MTTAILLEDNYYNRDIARTILERAGYTVTEGVNGQEGLDILAKETFDLLVVDLQMPRVNGITVIQNVRQDSRHQSMVIMVATANPHMIDEATQEHIDYVINKPYDVADFGELCKRIKNSRHGDI